MYSLKNNTPSIPPYIYTLLQRLPLSLPIHTATEGSSSASSSDDEIKEAFESCLPSSPPAWRAGHTHWVQRPVRVAPSSYRKRVPKYFAQMASTAAIERPRLDFNKMQSRRLVMVGGRHNSQYYNIRILSLIRYVSRPSCATIALDLQQW